MYIIYDLEDNVISICSSKKTLILAVESLESGRIRVEHWGECPEDIKNYLSRT